MNNDLTRFLRFLIKILVAFLIHLALRLYGNEWLATRFFLTAVLVLMWLELINDAKTGIIRLHYCCATIDKKSRPRLFRFVFWGFTLGHCVATLLVLYTYKKNNSCNLNNSTIMETAEIVDGFTIAQTSSTDVTSRQKRQYKTEGMVLLQTNGRGRDNTIASLGGKWGHERGADVNIRFNHWYLPNLATIRNIQQKII